MRLPLPVQWLCEGARQTGMIHRPAGVATTGILMLPGGTDYRIGSHRSYVRIAEALAAAGYAVLRMDSRGMGDADGTHPGFESLAPEISRARAAFLTALPGLQRIILWGQCDGATGIVLGLLQGVTADGAILCNPWARTAAIEAEQIVRRYYLRQLSDPETWKRLLLGRVDLKQVARQILSFFYGVKTDSDDDNTTFLTETAQSLRACRIPLLVLIGEMDASGNEFGLFLKKLSLGSRAPAVSTIKGGDHSFSMHHMQVEVLEQTRNWIDSHFREAARARKVP